MHAYMYIYCTHIRMNMDVYHIHTHIYIYILYACTQPPIQSANMETVNDEPQEEELRMLGHLRAMERFLCGSDGTWENSGIDQT